MTTTTFYEKDYYLWLEQTIQDLKAGKWAELDITNLIEELEGVSRSEKRALESNLTVILLHLLKWKYQPTYRCNSWLSSINEHRFRVAKQMKQSPSLKPYLEQVFEECYGDAKILAEVETGLPLDTFPAESPFTTEETLNTDYLPEADTPNIA